MANRNGIPRFFSSDANAHLEATSENNLVLIDSTGLGRVHIKATLRHRMPQHHWVARFYDDTRFLIEAPNPRWLQIVTSHGTLRSKDVDLPAHHWDLALDEGIRLRPVWVQVRGFSTKLWFFHEFVKLFEPYGQVLVLDPATLDHIDFRVARVRVGLCDD